MEPVQISVDWGKERPLAVKYKMIHFEAPGVKSSLDEMGVMEIEMQESENTNEATMEPYREKTQIRNKHYLVV